MALDKAIKHGKEKRKPYRGAKAVCASCRNHGDCPHCEAGRRAKEERRKPITEGCTCSDTPWDFMGLTDRALWIDAACPLHGEASDAE
jgi:hypothetical protein